MFNITKKSIEWGGRTLTMETGRVARQADGAILITYGETVLLCTVVGKKSVNPDVDFFPMTINYQEKAFAAGKIPGGFFKREGRPTEKETLTCRLIDRPLRPLFPDGFYNETQIICTLMSHDLENNPDVIAMIGASAALTISGLPFMGPIAGARVGYSEGEYILNPTMEEIEKSDLDLVVAGTKSSVLMVESEAKELSEDVMLGAVNFGHKEMQPVIDMIIDLAETCAKEPWAFETPQNENLTKRVAELAESDLRETYKIIDKQERSTRLDDIRSKVKETLLAEEFNDKEIGDQLKKLEKNIVRTDAVQNKHRIDGRAPDEVRDISCEVGVLPMTHGSALFTRGETQALVVTTLGTSRDEQIIDALEGEYKEDFLLHYNFPPFSVGEVGRTGFTSRRETGHGKLAWRAIHPLLPEKDDFPYTLRCVSEVTESNGSSSMATVCGGALSMMDAGVPLKRAVAGIAMGLIKEKDGYIVLSDILGDEDHLGDMDFKVAGTEEGITSLQMDIKIDGITSEIMEVALEQANRGRKHILGEMGKALTAPRAEVGEHAPRIVTMQISKDKIREVIGSGGKVIREICEVTGAKVDIEDDGTVRIAAVNDDQSKKAYEWIHGIVAEPEIGVVYDGKVVRIVDFGAFVNFFGSRDGLVHISELANERVGKVTDVIQEGDTVKVKVLDVDNRGKVRLSMRAVDQDSGEDISESLPPREKKPAQN